MNCENIWSNSPRKPLPDVLDFIVDNRGKTVPTAKNGHILIATNCVRNENLYPSYEKIRYLSDDTYQHWFRAHPKPGDILFVCKGTPGRVCLVPNPVDFCIAQDMVALRVNKQIVYNKYLLAVLRNRLIQEQIAKTSVGDVIPHFKKSHFGQLLIPLPAFNIQTMIGDNYFTLSEKIENNKRINHHLEQMAQAIFKSWFVDFEPFGGTMPDDWQHEKLGDICQCVLGGTPSRNKVEYWNGKIPWINSGEINRFRITSPSEYITEQGLNHSSTKMLPAKTVVLAITGATLGQISILEIDSCANQSVVGIIPNDELPYEFIYPFIKDNIQNIISNKTGGAQQHINKQNIESVQLFLPTNQEIIKYNHQVAPIYAAIANNCFENARLAELRDTLLPRLMSGELSVADLKENV